MLLLLHAIIDIIGCISEGSRVWSVFLLTTAKFNSNYAITLTHRPCSIIRNAVALEEPERPLGLRTEGCRLPEEKGDPSKRG